MRILMVHDTALDGGYGAETYVRRLVAGLRAAGDDVEVVAGEVTHRGIRRALDLWDPYARRLVAERARAGRAELVHHHNVTRELSASVLGACPGLPAVMTVHDQRLLGAREHAAYSPRGLAEAAGSALARTGARRRLAAVVGVSDTVTAALRRHGFGDAVTVPVPAGVPLAAPRPVAGCTDVVVLARLTPDKGVDVVIDAMARLSARLPDTRLHVAGDGPLRAVLRQRAAPLGDRVVFHGRLDEAGVSRLLGAARVVAVASLPRHRPEGSSLTTVEAAAHGRPVVASDDPAVQEAARSLPGVTVVPAGDVAATAAALQRVLEDPALARQHGESNRAAVADRYSIEAVTAATRAVYDRVRRRPA